MIQSTLKSTLPLALLWTAVAAQAPAQTVLTDTAPGTTTRTITIEDQTTHPQVQPEQNFGQTNIPATDIIRELAPVAGGNPGAPRTVRTPTGVVIMDATRAIDLTVFFSYDSAQLLPEARAQLDALGHALNSPELSPYGFLIAGHTDARGPAGYNLDLSIRRALSVADYLVRFHHISPSRLVAHGWGEGQLLAPSDPTSGVNRRVEVSLLLPQQTQRTQPSHSHIEYVQPTVTWTYPAQNWTLLPAPHSYLTDPRWRLRSDGLDDFHATPTWVLR